MKTSELKKRRTQVVRDVGRLLGAKGELLKDAEESIAKSLGMHPKHFAKMRRGDVHLSAKVVEALKGKLEGKAAHIDLSVLMNPGKRQEAIPKPANRRPMSCPPPLATEAQAKVRKVRRKGTKRRLPEEVLVELTSMQSSPGQNRTCVKFRGDQLVVRTGSRTVELDLEPHTEVVMKADALVVKSTRGRSLTISL